MEVFWHTILEIRRKNSGTQSALQKKQQLFDLEIWLDMWNGKAHTHIEDLTTKIYKEIEQMDCRMTLHRMSPDEKETLQIVHPIDTNVVSVYVFMNRVYMIYINVYAVY